MADVNETKFIKTEANGNLDADRGDEHYHHQPPAKRSRIKHDDSVDPTNPEPSMVLHVRNLNMKATEADLLEALSHFGKIAYATCMPNKRMALVEFEELSAAKSCVAYSQTNQIYVAGQPALFNFSTSKNIQRIGLESENPNRVVILTVYNAQYPITVNIIHQICKPHGRVQRIALLRRALLQALVEFDTVDAATKAKYALNGADIYSGCCTVKIEYAKPEYVKITRNDQDQVDYTLGGNPSGGEPPSGAPPNRQGLLGSASNGGPMHRPGPGYGGGGGPGYGYGNGYDYPGYGRPPMGGPPGGYSGGPAMGRGGGGGGGGRGHGGPMPGYGAADMYGEADDYNDSCVVMVYGIDQEKFNCDKLFNMLCLYGNVFRIKFMKSKPDTAMVQMGDRQQVRCAIGNLHGATLYGQKLALRVSKQPTLHDIREPFALEDGSPSFKDFNNSRNNRFLTPDAAARNRVLHPTNCLHWFNAPHNMTEEKMTEIMSANGAPAPTKVIIFPVKSERSSSGIAEFETDEDALTALMLNNHTPVDSPIGKVPYIVKLAFAWPKER